MANVGGALTGQDDETDNPLKSILGSAGGGIESIMPQDPASRSALLQIGLNMMQPIAMGQTVAGHIGQAIGAGGETEARGEKMDIDKEKVEDKLSIAQKNLEIQQQRADSAAERARNAGTINAYQAERLRLMGEAGGRAEAGAAFRESQADKRAKDLADREDRKNMRKDVEDAVAARDNLVTEETDPDKVQWKGKSRQDIQRIIQQRDYPHLGGATTPPATPATPTTTPAPTAPPTTVTQGGHTYRLQPDGSYK